MKVKKITVLYGNEELECEVTYDERIEKYGEDIDGNRGIERIILDNVEITSIYPNSFFTKSDYEEIYNIALDTLLNP